jgi:hypothetical protein
MGKLYRSHSKYTISGNALKAAVGKKTYDEIHPIGAGVEQQENAAKAAEQAAEDAASKPTIPLPDEEELARIRRRRAARRTGGRDSTILAGDDTFGPG